MSNLGRWATWYEGRRDPMPYGDTETYRLAADFLAGLAVEDWGCGLGWFRRFHDGDYLGIDGTDSYFCDVVDDLVSRRSVSEGVLLRHVLEHNPDWEEILRNAVASATCRIVVVCFIPSGSGEQVGWTDELGVPDIAIPYSAVDAALEHHRVDRTTLASATSYGVETIWRAEVLHGGMGRRPDEGGPPPVAGADPR